MVRRGRGFTLIELLVVVAIIALLIAILLPSLGKARSMAKRSACLSNVRGMGITLQLYIAENQRMFAYDFVTTGNYWTDVLKASAGSGVDKLRQCPEATSAANPNSQGSSTLAWNTPGGANIGTGAYGLNGWLYSYNPTTDTQLKRYAVDLNEGGASVSNFYTPNIRGSTGIVPVMADACWPDGWPMESNTAPTTKAAIAAGDHSGTNSMLRYLISRHAMTINVAFFDGHAENTKLQDLSKLRWHANWNRSTPLTMPLN